MAVRLFSICSLGGCASHDSLFGVFLLWFLPVLKLFGVCVPYRAAAVVCSAQNAADKARDIAKTTAAVAATALIAGVRRRSTALDEPSCVLDLVVCSAICQRMETSSPACS